MGDSSVVKGEGDDFEECRLALDQIPTPVDDQGAPSYSVSASSRQSKRSRRALESATHAWPFVGSANMVTYISIDITFFASYIHIQLDGGLNLRFLRVVNLNPRIAIVISPGELSTSFRGDQSVLFEFSFSSRLEWYANTTTRKKRRKSIAI